MVDFSKESAKIKEFGAILQKMLNFEPQLKN